MHTVLVVSLEVSKSLACWHRTSLPTPQFLVQEKSTQHAGTDESVRLAHEEKRINVSEHVSILANQDGKSYMPCCQVTYTQCVTNIRERRLDSVVGFVRHSMSQEFGARDSDLRVLSMCGCVRREDWFSLRPDWYRSLQIQDFGGSEVRVLCSEIDVADALMDSAAAFGYSR